MKDRSWLVVFILSLTVAISLAEYAWTGSTWEWRETKTRSRPDDDDSEQGSGGGIGGLPDDEDNYEDDSDDSASPWRPRTAPAGPVHNLRLFASQLSKDNKVLPLQRSLRVTWSPPDKEKWNNCLLGYAVGYKMTKWARQEPYVFEQVEGNYTRRGDDKPLYFNEEEGAQHSHIIGGLDPHTEYTVTLRVSNPWGRFESLIINEVSEFTELEACTLAPLPDAETFVDVSGTTFSLHLQNWKGGNCPNFANFAIYMDDSNEWDLLVAHARDPEWKLGTLERNRDSGATYRVKVIRKSLHYVSDEVYEYSSYDFKESEARYEISTLPGSSPGCIIELGVKYSGNNLISKVDIDQEGCATLCLTEAKCTHWTYNPTRGKCWLKTSSQGRAASTKGSNSGQKTCGVLETETETATVPQSSKVNKAKNLTICLLCIPACKIEENVKFAGSNLYNEQDITQTACAELCFREPECHFWTHNAKRTVSKCWLKTDDKGKAASTKGSVSGQKSCGVTGLDISSGLALQDGCECEPACTIEENVKFGGQNVYDKKGIKGGKGAPGCAALCYRDPKCHFWTYNGRARKCWLKKSDKGRAPSTKGSISGQKACGEESALALFPLAKGIVPGKDLNTENRHVDYSPGDTNLIFTVPHDGRLKPASIPDRTPGCKNRAGVCQFPGESICPHSKVCKVLLWSDSNTRDFAQRVREEFTAITGLTPHLVVNLLHRSKLDGNRGLEDAAQGSPGAELAYRDFHGAIERAKASLAGETGLVLDFHGQRHGQNSTELGYLYSKSQLNTGSLKTFGRISSVSSLLDRTGLSPEALLTGEGSLGAGLERAGYRALPGPRQPRPGKDKYYRGGYITQTHGSGSGGRVDCIQLELPSELTNTTLSRRKFAETIGGVVADFHKRYYL